MKVSIVENWADIAGEIKSVRPNPEAKGFVSAEIVLHDVRAVPEFANLLDGRVGESIAVNVPEELGRRLGLKAGAMFCGRVRQGGVKNYFVHPEHATLLHKS